jgi:3-deoxy-manno-octulosonate cytidylyltransferase (CMP-KDO synthetase)
MDPGSFAVVIPARFGSTRLPGKPLRTLLGKPLVLWVYEQALATGAEYVAVATDDERIAEVVRGAGGRVVLTRSDHPSGTDRVAEVAQRAEFDDETIVVNLQGDEPLVHPQLVSELAVALAERPAAQIATLATPLEHEAQRSDPNVVKVVTDRDGFALYFSRHAIPYPRQAPEQTSPGAGSLGLRHVGLYAYRTKILRALTAHPAVQLEQAECLEQLRALWLGLRVFVKSVADAPGHGVDTEADVRRVEALLREQR